MCAPIAQSAGGGWLKISTSVGSNPTGRTTFPVAIIQGRSYYLISDVVSDLNSFRETRQSTGWPGHACNGFGVIATFLKA